MDGTEHQGSLRRGRRGLYVLENGDHDDDQQEARVELRQGEQRVAKLQKELSGGSLGLTAGCGLLPLPVAVTYAHLQGSTHSTGLKIQREGPM
jgi:hypothetical protein